MLPAALLHLPGRLLPQAVALRSQCALRLHRLLLFQAAPLRAAGGMRLLRLLLPKTVQLLHADVLPSLVHVWFGSLRCTIAE